MSGDGGCLNIDRYSSGSAEEGHGFSDRLYGAGWLQMTYFKSKDTSPVEQVKCILHAVGL